MSLVARYLEANGLPTVVIGSARDIVEHCGVPRFVFTDLPLGNPCGPPWDRGAQESVVALALGLLQSAAGPRSTLRAAVEWPNDPGWRARYGRVDPAEAKRLTEIGEARRQRQAAQKGGTY